MKKAKKIKINNILDDLPNYYQVYKLLEKYNITFEQFKKFVKAEKFTLKEIADVGYMEDKMQIWRDMIEDNLLQENLAEHFKKNEIPMIARYIMRNKLSISQVAWEESKSGITQEEWLALADHIIGYCQENLEYEE